MFSKQWLKKISSFEWEIPRERKDGMLVPVRIFATERIIDRALDDNSFTQAMNAACLPGVVGQVVVMPDVHQGYGFPIGGVAAMHYPDGVISPGGIGYDINCGVRLLSSQLTFDEAKSKLETLSYALNSACPSGVGSTGKVKLRKQDFESVCTDGSEWALKNGYATENDLRRTEANGKLEGGSFSAVSRHAYERGLAQIGTLGAGNHFIEVDLIEEVFDPDTAGAYGLLEGCLAVQIHCGSRGFGHQICSDYVQSFQGAVKRYKISLPDRELVCAPLNSPEGQAYLAAMRCAANFAFANRQVLAFHARGAFEAALAGKGLPFQLYQVYDIAHNMAKIETHTIAGREMQVCVHRKGATRAFGPGHPELPEEYRPLGQPVLVPGSMGTASWVLVGTAESMQRSFGSSCHGAGRVMSRAQAKKQVRGEALRRDLEADGIHVRAGSLPGLAEEAPQAYKDVDDVVAVVSGSGIARKVARLRPVAVIKG